MIQENTKLKEKICDNLNPKKFEVTWTEDIEYSATIIAGSQDEAREKFSNGEYEDEEQGDGYVDQDSVEIYETK